MADNILSSGRNEALCLVAGGCGFLGSHLVHRLLKEGYRVLILDPNIKNTFHFKKNSKVKLIEGRSSDRIILKKALRNVDFFFYFVSATLPEASTKNPLPDIEHNLIQTIQVIEESAKAGVKKIIFPSSGGAIYGVPQNIPIHESHPTDPISSYGILKLTIEKYLHLYQRKVGLNYLIFRFGNPYGPGQYPRCGFGVIPNFFECMALNKSISVIGNGETIRDFIYIDDVINATINGLKYTGSQSIFNIGSGTGTKINQLIPIIEKLTQKKAQITSLPTRMSDVPKVILDISAAKKELKWFPSTSLEEGLTKTWEWFRKTIIYEKE